MFEELNPSPRLLMGPGPINVDPRVLRAMSMPLLGQFDPQFTGYMNETMALLRELFQTANRWSFLVDGTARAGIEAVLVSLIEPGDRVLVPIFGRFGHLLHEIAARCGAEVITMETEWGTVFEPERDRGRDQARAPEARRLRARRHLDHDGAAARRDRRASAAATIACSMSMPPPPWAAWISRSIAGRSMPPPPACRSACRARPAPRRSPSTSGSSARSCAASTSRPASARPATSRRTGRRIQSNYFDLAMLMDYWGEARLNHHTEAASMLYAARECARIVLREGLPDSLRAPRARQPRAGAPACRRWA